MHVRSAGEGISDTSTDTGCRAAEGLDLCGVVVSFVLEHKEEVAVLTVDVCGNVNGAGVDLLALVKLGELASLFEHLYCDGCDIHQSLGALCRLFLSVNLDSGCEVSVISGRYCFIVYFYVIDMSREGGVTAMVRPVCIDNSDFCDSGISFFFISEVALEELEVVYIHSKTELVKKSGHSFLVKRDESVYCCYGFGNCIVDSQSFGLVKRCLAALYRVDYVPFDFVYVVLGDITLENVYLCGAYGGTLTAGNYLYALRRGVSSLIVLTGQIFNSEHLAAASIKLGGHHVKLRLGENGTDCLVKKATVNIFNVIAVEDTHTLESLDAYKLAKLSKESVCLVSKLRFLFYVYSVNHTLLLGSY